MATIDIVTDTTTDANGGPRNPDAITSRRVAADLGTSKNWVNKLIRASRKFPPEVRIWDLGPSLHMKAHPYFGSAAATFEGLTKMGGSNVRLVDIVALYASASDQGESKMGMSAGNSEKWPEWTGWRVARAYRERTGMSVNEVAAKAKVSPGWITSIELGHNRNPPIRALLSYTEALGLPPGALIEG